MAEVVKQSPSTVTVGCKLPHGLILKIGTMVERDEPVMGGGMKTVKVFMPSAQQVTIKGYAAPHGRSPSVPVIGGYALTTGVDAEFFKTWMEQNKDLPAVKAGLVFSHARFDSAEARALEGADIVNGLEPLAQENDPRVPRGIKRAEENDRRSAA